MRVVIAEDSVILRSGLIRLLEEVGEDVVAAVGDAASLLLAVEEHSPDVVIVDVRMPPNFSDDGLQCAIEIRKYTPDVGILVFSQYVEKTYAAELISSGVEGIGYLLKDRVGQVDEFIDALRRVGNRGTAIDPDIIAQLLATKSRQDPLQSLTERERDTLKLMAQGLSNQAISERLFVSLGAVEKYVTNIFMKLDLFPSDSENRRVVAVLTWLNQ